MIYIVVFCYNIIKDYCLIFLNNSVMENRTRNKKTVRRLLDKIRRFLDHSVASNGGMTSLKFVYRCLGDSVCEA